MIPVTADVGPCADCLSQIVANLNKKQILRFAKDAV